MIRVFSRNVVRAIGFSAVVIAPVALAETVASFSDPSPSGTTPLFMYDGLTLNGGWSGTGLTLTTPGIPSAGDFSNATFQLTQLNVITNLGSVVLLSGGDVRFYDNTSTEILRIAFSGATLTPGTSLGGSDFVGHNVDFSGSILNGYTNVSNEAFAFSFANPVGTPSAFTVTSAFTSSAELLVPSPAGLGLFGVAGLGLARRRRA